MFIYLVLSLNVEQTASFEMKPHKQIGSGAFQHSSKNTDMLEQPQHGIEVSMPASKTLCFFSDFSFVWNEANTAIIYIWFVKVLKILRKLLSIIFYKGIIFAIGHFVKLFKSLMFFTQNGCRCFLLRYVRHLS